MPNSPFGTLPAQLVRHADLGPLAYLRPDDITPPFMHVREEQASGTNGGTSTSTTYHDRVLNTVLTNTIAAASLSSNQVTLPAGTYEFEAAAPSFSGSAGPSMLFLYNVTDSVNIARGETGTGNTSQNTVAFCSGRFQLAAPKVIKLRHYIANGQVTNGLGVSLGLAGVAEAYSYLKLWQVSK